MENIPEKIYLQVEYIDQAKAKDFYELNNVEWMEERYRESDVEYTRTSKDDWIKITLETMPEDGETVLISDGKCCLIASLDKIEGIWSCGEYTFNILSFTNYMFLPKLPTK